MEHFEPPCVIKTTNPVRMVLAPMKQFYGEQFEIAPFAGLVDSGKVRTLLLQEQPDLFPSEVGYIFRKQLEAACARVNATCRIETLQSFRPFYPRPPYRLSSVV
jgi:hypothetical protein